MRLILVMLITVELCSCHHSTARIHVHLDDSATNQIMVLIPLKGANFRANSPVYPLHGDNNCEIEIPAKDCGLIMIKTRLNTPRIFTFPGDDIYIYEYTDGSMSFKGDNATGHAFYTALHRDVNPCKGDTVPARIVDTIHARRDRELAQLEEINVTPAYRKLASMDIRYYYAASQADAMLRFNNKCGEK